MKKLMILGGSRYAVPVIEAAHKFFRLQSMMG